ncbi:hypothetical protein KP509_10G003500 [Ceratopteris richardii]|uniref:Glycosyltransferase n=1 Tax=Ceratopteris richardii TaxID=49495 RepID=A0A8T2U1H5_CERRI|nr:hypothetical protein KP509_10G003500 [Ceratopteris richardii]
MKMKNQPAEENVGLVTKSTSTNIAHVDPRLNFPLQFKKNKKRLFILICFFTISVAMLSYAGLSPTTAASHLLSTPLQLFDGILRHGRQKSVKEILERVAMPKSKTVIITALNAAWAKKGTMIDIFLESLKNGQGTLTLLHHLLIVSVDKIAYRRCLTIHPHCLFISTPGVDFSGEQLLLSEDYIKLMWRRIRFLQTVLQMNYTFLFTDADVLWLRNPLTLLEADPEADFQIACDQYNGNPSDKHNHPNAGFTYVRPNERTVRFYGYWYKERTRGARMADQEVLNAIKSEDEFARIGLKMKFLDTRYIGGFCAMRSTDMTKAITMHANCCKGLKAKLADLRMILEKWKAWQLVHRKATMISASRGDQTRPSQNNSAVAMDPRFPTPFACPRSWQ